MTKTQKRIKVGEARRFSASHVRMQKKVENAFVPKIFNAIKEQINTFLKAIDERGYQYAKSNIFTIVPFLPIEKVIKDLYRKAAYIESNYVIGYLARSKKYERFIVNEEGPELFILNPKGKIVPNLSGFEVKKKRPILGIGFDDLAPLIDQYFQIYLLNNSALPITATTRKIITTYLINQVDAGVPLQQAIEEFKDLAITGGSPSSLKRAITIARTSSTTALSFGGLIGAYMTGIDVDKVWVTSNDERVRGFPNYPAPFPHTLLDLQEAELMGSFYNGESIRFPGDPEASLENTINCRCAQYFKEKENPAPVEERQLENFLIDLFSGLFIGFAIGENVN